MTAPRVDYDLDFRSAYLGDGGSNTFWVIKISANAAQLPCKEVHFKSAAADNSPRISELRSRFSDCKQSQGTSRLYKWRKRVQFLSESNKVDSCCEVGWLRTGHISARSESIKWAVKSRPSLKDCFSIIETESLRKQQEIKYHRLWDA
jgi:hypothetical protein